MTKKMRLLEGSKVCCHKHQKIVIVLVDFQNKAFII